MLRIKWDKTHSGNWFLAMLLARRRNRFASRGQVIEGTKHEKI